MTALSRLNTVLVATFCLFLASCTSAAEHLETGIGLEAQGDLYAAAERYIEALEKDESLVEARQRLEDLAPRLIQQQLDDTRTARDDDRPVVAADGMRTLDSFLRDARRVGVRPDPGGDYDGFRRTIFDGAIARLIRDAAADRDDDVFSDALRTLDRLRRYEPDRDQQEEEFRARVQTHLAWGRGELDHGRFRAAFDQGDAVLALVGGSGAPDAEMALDLQVEALDLGTVGLAAVPIWRRADAASDLSVSAVDALNDQLLLDYWQAPPPFIAVLDPAAVRREIRRGGYESGGVTEREGTLVGRVVGADYLVMGEVAEFSGVESGVETRVRSADDQAGRTQQYRVVRGRLTLKLLLEFTLIDVVSGDVVDDYRVEASEAGRFERGEYDGDWTDLRLSRDQRRLFDPVARSARHREAEDALIDEAAERYADRIFQEVLRRVP